MDRVLVVEDYWDQPRKGFAEYQGRPHYFTCGFDVEADDYSHVHHLVPVDQATLDLALEREAIWLVWESDFRNGRATVDTHPRHGGINARYDELSRKQAEVLAALPPSNIRVAACFSWAPEDAVIPSNIRPWLVTWTELPADDERN